MGSAMSEVQVKSIDCPDCKGSGNHVYQTICESNAKCGPTAEVRWCDRCKSSGRVPEEMLLWIENGKKLKARRIEQRKTFSDVAREWMTTPVVVSLCEVGKIDNSRFVSADFISQ